MSSFTAEAGAIVAAFQLLAVRAVTGAEKAADLESGDVLTPSGIVEKPGPPPSQHVDQFEPQSREQTDRSLLRQPYHFNRAIAVSPHSVPTLLHRPIFQPVCPPKCTQACDDPSASASTPTNPIEPPWKILPWMDRAHRHVIIIRQIKLIPVSSDMSYRGKMIDVVI